MHYIEVYFPPSTFLVPYIFSIRLYPSGLLVLEGRGKTGPAI